VLVGIIEKGCYLFFLPRVERARDNRSAGGLDLPDQRLELGAVAPAREDGESLGGEFLRNLGADIVAGADHRGRSVAFLHLIHSTILILRSGIFAASRRMKKKQPPWFETPREMRGSSP
jgi:hypothetical protein